MKEGDHINQKKKRKTVLLVIMICLLAVIAGIVAGILISNITRNNQNNNNNREYDSSLSDIKEKETSEPETIVESIAIPCFETMILAADTTEQQVNFYNPEKNTGVDFQLSMYLVSDDDSKEDVLIWQSGLIPCGKAIYNITLNQPLAAGQYQARLQYSCFSQSGKQLNGSNLNFNLIVE